jgi:hypothetical protein
MRLTVDFFFIHRALIVSNLISYYICTNYLIARFTLIVWVLRCCMLMLRATETAASSGHSYCGSIISLKSFTSDETRPRCTTITTSVAAVAWRYLALNFDRTSLSSC